MRYQLRIKGHLHQRWSAWLYDFEVTHLADGTTALTGDLPDDAAVYGLLSRLRDTGAMLISFGIADHVTADQESDF